MGPGLALVGPGLALVFSKGPGSAYGGLCKSDVLSLPKGGFPTAGQRPGGAAL